MRTILRRSLLAALCLALASGAAVSMRAQTPAAVVRATSPETFFGHAIGADYVLPNYTSTPSSSG